MDNIKLLECCDLLAKIERLEEDFYKIEEISLIHSQDDEILDLKDKLENLIAVKISGLKDILENKTKKLKKADLLYLVNR